MRYDISTMRQQADAMPGDKVAIAKGDYRLLLDALERGQNAEEALTRVRGLLLGTTATGIAA